MGIELTKDAEKTLCEIYVVYMGRRADGESKASAANFGNKDCWPDPDWRTSDGEAYIDELAHADMLRLNIVGGFEITDKAIIYMENRFKNKCSDILRGVAEVKSVIPFL